MHEATRKLLGVLLREMDGFDAGKKTIVIGATNRRSDLDPALLSRFDSSVSFLLPDEACRCRVSGSSLQSLSKIKGQACIWCSFHGRLDKSRSLAQMRENSGRKQFLCNACLVPCPCCDISTIGAMQGGDHADLCAAAERWRAAAAGGSNRRPVRARPARHCCSHRARLGIQGAHACDTTEILACTVARRTYSM